MKIKMNKNAILNISSLALLGGITLFLLALVGEVKCIIKAVQCNWEPVGKAEVIYTGAAFTGFGCIVGWVDIEDK